MSLSSLDQAITSHPFQPKGINVGTELWRSLVAAGRIKWQRGYLESVVDTGINFPVLDEKIFIHVSPELDAAAYEFPINP